ncbi:MAG: DUF86 domain-containing protein [Actinomycetota bacterium]
MNKEIILDRFKELEDNLAILEKLSKIEKEKFISSPETYKLAERCLQLSIECVLDVTHYILAQKNLPRAEGGEAIIALGEHRIIPMEFTKEIRPMAGFRNILVHEYLKIDRKRVYEYTGKIEDFRKFERYILEFLEKTEEG